MITVDHTMQDIQAEHTPTPALQHLSGVERSTMSHLRERREWTRCAELSLSRIWQFTALQKERKQQLVNVWVSEVVHGGVLRCYRTNIVIILIHHDIGIKIIISVLKKDVTYTIE